MGAAGQGDQEIHTTYGPGVILQKRTFPSVPVPIWSLDGMFPFTIVEDVSHEVLRGIQQWWQLLILHFLFSSSLANEDGTLPNKIPSTFTDGDSHHRS